MRTNPKSKHRITALVLCFLMVLSHVPASVFADDSGDLCAVCGEPGCIAHCSICGKEGCNEFHEECATCGEYNCAGHIATETPTMAPAAAIDEGEEDSIVGRTATFNTESVWLYSTPGVMSQIIATSLLPGSVVITEVSGEFYCIDAAEGYIWPADYAGAHYVKSSVLTLEESRPATVPSVSHGSGITVSSDSGIPAGTEIKASAVEGGYDIKILDADGNEWQPIDDGKTVTISIPVSGIADGSFVDVYHFIDYAKDINGDEEIVDISDADDAVKTLLAGAIAAYGDGIHVAAEITKKVQVSGGQAEVGTDSFSVYIVDDGAYSSGDGNSSDSRINYYDTKNMSFIVTKNSVVYIKKYWSNQSSFSITDNSWATISSTTRDGTVIYTSYASFTVNSGAEYYSGYPVYWRYGEGNDTIVNYFYVVPKITPNYSAGAVIGATLPSADTNEYLLGRDTAVDGVEFPYESYTFPAAASATGYTFDGWLLDLDNDGIKDDNETVYPEGAVVVLNRTLLGLSSDPTADVTMALVAQWNAINYAIEYNLNEGTLKDGVTNPTSYTNQDNLTINAPTKAGYRFNGWAVEFAGMDTAEGDNWADSYSGDTVSLSNMYGSVKLTADWVKVVTLATSIKNTEGTTTGTVGYVLSEEEGSATGNLTEDYVCDAGSHPNAVLIFTPGDGYEIVAVRHTVDGVEQTGGFSESSYVCTIPSDGITADTIIAVTTALKTYTVSYDVNGGKETFAAQTKEYGKDLTLAATSPSRDGYSFTGWLGSDGKTYQPGAAYTENAALTLTAQWKVNQYTITFDTDGGNTIEAITQDYGTAITKPADPTKEGYTFAGWVYGDGGEATVPATMPAGNLTLKAIWTGNPYVVAFDGNGATGGDMTVQTFTYGDSQKLTANAYTRTGYQFLGWAKSADAASAEYSDGASVSNLTLESRVTLYAVWQKISYTVTYNTNGGEPITAENVLYGDAVPLPTPEWDASKHQFVGWQYDEDIITSLTMPANDITLTAVWKHKYTVKHSYETLSGTDAVETETFWGAAGAIAAAETKVKTGYELFGDVPQVVITAEGDAVVNIEYKLIRSDITYEFSGNVPANAAVPAGQKDVPYGTEITLPIVSAEGYAFGGWLVDGEKIGDTYTMPATDIKFTGIYTYVDYDITLSGLDGATIENQPTKYNISQAVVLPAPSKRNYVFVGWRDASGTIIANTQDAPAIPVGSTGSKTFTAVWRIATADLTIEITGAAGQSHIFTVSGTDIENNPVSVKVAVLNGSATITNLPYGEYSVTSDETWSWRYDAEAAVQNVENFSGATVVEFVFTQDNGKWLSGLANRVYTLLTKSGNE